MALSPQKVKMFGADLDSDDSDDDNKDNKSNLIHTSSPMFRFPPLFKQFLSDILMTDIDNSIAVDKAQNHFACPANPRGAFDYAILQKYGIDRPQIPTLYIVCSNEHTTCGTPNDDYSSLFRYMKNRFAKDKKCWPFYVSVSYHNQVFGHRMCAYYFKNENIISLLDSSGAITDEWELEFVEKAILTHFAPNTEIITEKVYDPQNTENMEFSWIPDLPATIIADGGSCAIWSRFMYITGVLLGDMLSFSNLESLLLSLKRYFLTDNFVIKFQLFTASFATNTKKRKLSTSTRFIDVANNNINRRLFLN